MYHVTQCHRQGHRFDQNVEKKMQVERILVMAPPGVPSLLNQFCNSHRMINMKKANASINVGVYEQVPV